MKSPIQHKRSIISSNLRRPILGALALSLFAAPGIISGCAASFDPPTQIKTLRILGVEVDKPYVGFKPPPEDDPMAPMNPDDLYEDSVHLKMTLQDGYTESETARPIQIVWLGGCFNPPADQYFMCYEQLAKVFGAIEGGGPPPPEVLQYIGIGPEYTLPIPEDIVSSRPPPKTGPHYGIGYVFFAACAGQIKPVLPEGTGAAPDFPLGCFDESGRQLGAESFVPGYTQIYAFADGRTNNNPEIEAMTLDDKVIPDSEEDIPIVEACPVTEDERREAGCNAKDTSDCKSYTIQLQLDPEKAIDDDPDATGKNGESLTEAVWVSYFTDRGNIGPGIKLVNDPVAGFNPDLKTTYLPPDTPGFATIWAVVRDARGGSRVIRRFVDVQAAAP